MAGFFDFIAPFIGPAATVGSALIGAGAAGRAADTGAAAAQSSADAQERMFQQSRADLAPYRETGQQALYSLADLYGVPRPAWGGGFTPQGSFEGSPGYQFRLNEGIRGIDRSAAARGNLLSGNTLRGVANYSQGLASDEFQNYANRLAALSGTGQTSSAQTGQLGSAAAGNIGNALMAGGASQAAGQIGQANAYQNALNNLMYIYGSQGGYGGPTNANINWWGPRIGA